MGRDKFAAMASRAAESSTSPPSQDTASNTQASGTSVPPRRDKLAALSSRSAPNAETESAGSTAPSNRRGNKLAAMAARGQPASRGSESSDQQKTQEEKQKGERLVKLKERLSKRKKILRNLDRAEDLTCKLLQIAHQTTTSLQDVTSPPDLSKLSKAYRATLQEIHPLLSTDTQELIHPYQNHAKETKQSMYAARVEMRLAQERTQVLRALTELEQTQQQSTPSAINGITNESKKRSREDDEPVIN